SRRRHTSFSRDWSSDVCSSDLAAGEDRWAFRDDLGRQVVIHDAKSGDVVHRIDLTVAAPMAQNVAYGASSDGHLFGTTSGELVRSEERRVGKEYRYSG